MSDLLVQYRNVFALLAVIGFVIHNVIAMQVHKRTGRYPSFFGIYQDESLSKGVRIVALVNGYATVFLGILAVAGSMGPGK